MQEGPRRTGHRQLENEVSTDDFNDYEQQPGKARIALSCHCNITVEANAQKLSNSCCLSSFALSNSSDTSVGPSLPPCFSCSKRFFTFLGVNSFPHIGEHNFVGFRDINAR